MTTTTPPRPVNSSDPFSMAFAEAARDLQSRPPASPPTPPPVETTLRAFRRSIDSTASKAASPKDDRKSDTDNLFRDLSNLRAENETLNRDNRSLKTRCKQLKKDNKNLSHHLIKSHRETAELKVQVTALQSGRTVNQQHRFNNRENLISASNSGTTRSTISRMR